MKRARKFIAYMLVFALMLGTLGGVSLNTAVTQAEETENFAYVINEDGTITITEAKQAAGDIIVPYAIDGHVVTGIGGHANQWSGGMSGAFEGKWSTTNVYLPDTITYFGERAFASCSIEHIYSYGVSDVLIGSTLPSEGADVPQEDGMDSDAVPVPDDDLIVSGSALAFPASLTTIEAHCFDTSKLQEINLPVSIKTINDAAFINTNVVDFVIPEDAQVDYLGAGLFNSSLATITIKGHVSVIADRAFSAIASLKTVTVEKTGSVGTIGSYCFENSGASDFNLYFYGRVDVLGNNAMQGSGGITDFYMENVGVIGSEAFLNCHIHTLTLKGSISSIGDRAFVGCGNVDTVTIDSSTPYTIGKYAFNNSSIRKVVFSDGLTVVQEGTFSGCGQLEEVYLPSTLEKIEENAFENVSSIKTITINDTAVVDENAFRGAGGSTWEALDRTNNASVKKIVDKALNRSSVTPTPGPTAKTVKVSKVKFKKAKSNKKKTKATLNWKKNSKATGYIIYVKVVKKGKKASKVKWKKVKTIKKNKTTKLTVKISKSQKKVLKKKGKIYYGIRAYKTVKENGKKKTYYSGYSQKKLK